MEKNRVNEIKSVLRDLNNSSTTPLPSNLPTPDSYIVPGVIQPENTGVYDQINQIFNEQDKQAKTVQQTREILGEPSQSLSDEQVYDLTSEIDYLVDTWIEEFERKIFNGKTLEEVTNI